MKLRHLLYSTAVVVAAFAVSAQPSSTEKYDIHEAPPTPPAIAENGVNTPSSRGQFRSATLNQYEIGDLTDDEQYYLELINRARLDPPAEGLWLIGLTDTDVASSYDFFSVNLGLVLTDPNYGFNQFPAVQPLAPNAKLNTAARLHTQEMHDHTFQGHMNLADELATQRIEAQGYPWRRNGENVFSGANSVLHGHAGFQVDWGIGPGGIQNPPGHRVSIHNGLFREIGIGVMTIDGRRANIHPPGDPLNPEDPEKPGVGLDSRFRDVGPQLVTQVLADQLDANPFVTGVAYYDLNANGSYEPGEGIGNAEVSVDAVQDYAVTINSGGYAIPMPGNGGYTATFTLGSVATQIPFTISDGLNTKVDFSPTYLPPAISGPALAAVNGSTPYAISPVLGATAYQYRRSELGLITEIEGAENGLGDFDVLVSNTPNNYTVRVSNKRASGSFAFRLAHPTTEDQFLVYKKTLRPRANAMLTFFSRLEWAFENEVARVELSTDQGASWATVWSQAGSTPLSVLEEENPQPTPAETSFNRRDVSLAAYEGQDVFIRFQFEFSSGSIWQGNDSVTSTGWYFDNIQFTNVDALEGEATTELGNQTNFNFVATAENKYAIQARARISDRWFPWGPTLSVTGSNDVIAAPVVSESSISRSGTTATIAFSVMGNSPSIKLLSSQDPNGPWSEVVGAVVTSLGNSNYSVQINTGTAGESFYRISAQ